MPRLKEMNRARLGCRNSFHPVLLASPPWQQQASVAMEGYPVTMITDLEERGSGRSNQRDCQLGFD